MLIRGDAFGDHPQVVAHEPPVRETQYAHAARETHGELVQRRRVESGG